MNGVAVHILSRHGSNLQHELQKLLFGCDVVKDTCVGLYPFLVFLVVKLLKEVLAEHFL
jgi:hypothetical protein